MERRFGNKLYFRLHLFQILPAGKQLRNESTQRRSKILPCVFKEHQQHFEQLQIKYHFAGILMARQSSRARRQN
jgi:hypothetical protein